MNQSSFFRMSIFFALLFSFSHGEKPVELLISAAASLKNPLTEINPFFEKAYPGRILIFNFGSSGSLAQQIQNGAGADVFISANPHQVNGLVKRGLVKSNEVKVFLKNQLVLIVTARMTTVKDFPDLQKKEILKIALGEPRTVPAGQYAVEALRALNLESALKEKWVFAKDVTQVLFYVASGNADAGIVYLSDALVSDKVKIVIRLDPKLHSPITYVAASIATGQSPRDAQAFITFLMKDEKARGVFSRLGFLIR